MSFSWSSLSTTTWREVQACTSSRHPSSYKQPKHQHAPLCKEAQRGYRLTKAEKMLTGRKHVSLWKVIHRNKGLSQDTPRWHYLWYTVSHSEQWPMCRVRSKHGVSKGRSNSRGVSLHSGLLQERWVDAHYLHNNRIPAKHFSLFFFFQNKGTVCHKDKSKSLSRRQCGLLNGQVLIPSPPPHWVQTSVFPDIFIILM